MNQKENSDLISLVDLAKILDVNKSRLHYYVSRGLLSPLGIIGGAMIFKKDEAVLLCKGIIELQKEGNSLKDILMRVNPKAYADSEGNNK